MTINILRTNVVKSALRKMVADIAIEIIQKCPRYKGVHKSPLDIQTHSSFMKVRLVNACLVERQRVVDLVEYFTNRTEVVENIDEEYWSPTPAEFASKLATEINNGSYIEDRKLIRL